MIFDCNTVKIQIRDKSDFKWPKCVWLSFFQYSRHGLNTGQADTIFSNFAKRIWKPDKKSGIQKLEWYADDNYTGESDEDGARALQMVQGKMERITKWILMSGMKINVKKTEVFIFHRRNIITKDIQIMGEIITTYLCCNDLLWSY